MTSEKEDEMTEEKLAEKYVIDKYGTTAVSASAALKKAYIAGYKAGQPKWHKVAYGELPKDLTDVVTYSTSQGYQMKRFYSTVKIFGDLAVREVIAWCEIPKYEEE